jgi:diguanylate cyclase (GGDEF)-like protein
VKRLLRRFASLPTIVAIVVVLAAGVRLIDLSAERHAERAREGAVTTASSYAARIEPQLRQLHDLGVRQAALASRGSGEPDDLAATPPHAGTFWMTSDDQVLGALPAESLIAGGIASEWASAERGQALPRAAMLGPMRLGSEWVMAMRIPLEGAAAGKSPGWAVAYEDLDELIADAHLGHLAGAGFDFQLAQREPGTLPRIFVSSSNDPLTDPVTVRIRTPLPGAGRGGELELAIQPRAGWFPAGLLASDVALLVFLAWLIGFGTHDLIHALQRANSGLAHARTRMRSMSDKLAAEVQERMKLQETFDHARFHDTFTGLPNRRYFMDQLDRALRDVRTKRRTRIAVIIVDISRLKLINRLLGHTAGDDLMVQVARRFEEMTASMEAVLARWGGDQFALMLLDVGSSEAALQVANQLQERLRSPFDLRRHQLTVAATLGVACVDSGQMRAEDMMREADIAVAAAKRQETTRAILYAPSLGGQNKELVSLEADLHLALPKNQLRLVLQPVVDLATRRMVGAEALLRWQHPVEGVLTPDRFIGSAEEAGLMPQFTRWTIQRVIHIAAVWRRQLRPDHKFFLSVNLSPSALRDPGLAPYVGSLLERAKVPPAFLKFEVTELALLGDVAGARDGLSALHDLGVQLMLDDFGTGHSALSNLQLFPFELVKIDCPFVDNRGVFQANMSLVAAMIQLAGSLGLTSIAEIVEGEAAAASLKAMGCQFGQGYYFSGPVEPGVAFQRLLTQAAFDTAQAQSPSIETPVVREDGGHTLIMRRTASPSEGDLAMADTVIVRPLADGVSRELIISSVRTERAAAEETQKVRALPEDSSSTAVLPAQMVSGLHGEENDEEDEDE